ncbi:phosphatase PAP2 family protein [Catenulispora sp. NF23]|uniref:Phosphatase PAP2 family protein n=2 Tax=Catenulispora pinistramenti TaxID=2705254 RepID=A0ABS5L6A5_9ACTN|nr:phosphatase PAP2 family protein [Catenulispora pinistramenti]MBS2553839.1 phosphatase PAP2 family protein [Catenulispora pinistramenti]
MHWMMPYQMAFWLCGVLMVLAAGMYVSRKPVLVKYMPFPRELGTVLGLFGLWQVAGQLSVMKVDGALSRGKWIWDTERDLFLPSEHWLQGLFFPAHPTVVKFFNLYYASMHFTCMIIFLIWLFVRHREHYARARTTMAMATAFALAIQLIPVAPPRMIAEAHLTDTALYFHQSVYGAMDANSPDQLSAMPSVHVIWAVLVGFTVWRVSPSKWRWIGPVHTVLTITVVLVTANHYWADGIVGVALLLLSAGIQAGVRRGARWIRPGRVASAALTEPELARSSG